MAMLADTVDGVIGVDPHRDTLAAAAVTQVGGMLAQTTTSADAAGYQHLLGFACSTVVVRGSDVAPPVPSLEGASVPVLLA